MKEEPVGGWWDSVGDTGQGSQLRALAWITSEQTYNSGEDLNLPGVEKEGSSGLDFKHHTQSGGHTCSSLGIGALHPLVPSVKSEPRAV